MQWLESVRLAVAFAMLAGGAWLDLKSRRVRNAFWWPFLAIAAVLLLCDVAINGPSTLLWPIVSAAGLCVLFYLAWRFGLFGGADSKGLMVLALLVPRPLPHGLLSLPFAFDALANGALLVMLVPIGLLLWNLGHGWVRLPAILLATPMALDDAQAQHVWPMQSVGPDGKLLWHYWHRPAGDQAGAYDGLRAASITTVWATPKVPLLVFVAFGAVVAWLVGNLALLLTQAILS